MTAQKKSSRLWKSVFSTLLFFLSIQNVFSEELNVKSHRFKTKCALYLTGISNIFLTDKVTPKQLAFLENEKAIQILLNEEFNRTFSIDGVREKISNWVFDQSVSLKKPLEFLSKLPEAYYGLTQRYFLTDAFFLRHRVQKYFGPQELFFNMGYALKFQLVPPSKSHQELIRVRDQVDVHREYARFVIHFKNKDSFSTPIITGNDASVVFDMIEVGYYLDRIDDGTIKNSKGYRFSLDDIESIEFMHNHPESTITLVESENFCFWTGTIGPSEADVMAAQKIQKFLREHYAPLRENEVPLKMTLISSAGQVFVFRP